MIVYVVYTSDGMEATILKVYEDYDDAVEYQRGYEEGCDQYAFISKQEVQT